MRDKGVESALVSRADGEGAGLRTHWRILSGRHAQRSMLVATERVGEVVVGNEGILDEEEEIRPNEKVVGQPRTNKEVTQTVAKLTKKRTTCRPRDGYLMGLAGRGLWLWRALSMLCRGVSTSEQPLIS